MNSKFNVGGSYDEEHYNQNGPIYDTIFTYEKLREKNNPKWHQLYYIVSMYTHDLSDGRESRLETLSSLTGSKSRA